MTSRPRLGSRMLVVATAAMGVLLVVLAVLQYYWVGEVSEAARERLRRELETSADRIADDFDREVFRAFAAFQPPRAVDPALSESGAEELALGLADGWERWRASALEPELVAAVYVVDPERSRPHSDGVLWKLDPEARDLRPADWPPDLVELDQRFDLAGRGRRPPAFRQHGPRIPVVAPAPALLIPIRRWRGPRPPDDDAGRDARDAAAFVVVLLDRDFIGRVILPALVELHLGPEPRETGVWVLDRSRRDQPVFATGPVPPRPRDPEPGLAIRPLLGLRFFPELRAQGFRGFFDDRGRDPFLRSLHGGPLEQGQWALVVARTEGSLDTAVSKLRRRNLGVGLAVVALLAGTSALLLASARRVQRLARREMELVAGITHELRTPLAAIGSAADNLADGVVADPAQVRRYGSLIRGETHRLGTLVAQVLDFAGAAAARRRAARLEPVGVVAVVDQVLADLRFLIDEKGFAVERTVAPGLPDALADAEGLRRALDNVVGNALKYGEAGRWIGIHLATAGDDRIAIRVRDRGPGIARAERRRVFEPFYRGSSDKAPHQHGTGLGLAVTQSVLESFGGTIAIEDPDGRPGTTFLITLPVAPPSASTA